METVEAGAYCRQTPGGIVTVREAPDGIVLEGGADALARVERIFDTGHDPDTAASVLNRCAVLRPRLASLPGMRVPGCWEPFEMVVRVIVGQQISVKAARTIMGRLAARAPGFTPAALAGADLSGIGMAGRRSAALQSFARAVADGAVSFDGLPWAEVARQLAQLPGIGRWTLDYLAIRLGRDPDAFPSSDLGLLRAAGVTSPRELERMAEKWRPFRAYAAMYLWNVPAA